MSLLLDFIGCIVWAVLTDLFYAVSGLDAVHDKRVLTLAAIEDVLIEVDPLGWNLEDDPASEYAALAEAIASVTSSRRRRSEQRTAIIAVIEKAAAGDRPARGVRTIAARVTLMSRRAPVRAK